ncbi:MAG TPA: DUF1801 domain-containing protein [Aestuariivirga sp.]|nr:DUF1801 domain-containing protein [Hyphomicrobiales bacterium]HQY74802.1 DUF1801 domain-containing protein [Aestuariivirga sp.]
MAGKAKFTTIDGYIAQFPKEVQAILEKIRQTVADAAPGAVEAISYQIPTFKLNGSNLVHFAAWKDHIGFYATPAGNTAFQKELARYKMAKGSVQFPLDAPIPYDLVAEIARFRVKETQATGKAKS